MLPASDALWADAEQLSNAMLREAECAEHLAELARSCGARVSPPARGAGRSFRWRDQVNGHRAPLLLQMPSLSIDLMSV